MLLYKRMAAFALAMLMGLNIGFTAFANGLPETSGDDAEKKQPQISAVEEDKRAFESFTGVFKEVYQISENNMIRLENGDGVVCDFEIDEKTLIADGNGVISFEELAEGDGLKVYYVQPLISILIYPPRYVASVVVKNDNTLPFVSVDVFDENFLSSNKDLKLNINYENPILDQSGNTYDKSLENKALVVFYTITTRSIPPQTSPEKIIVLDIEKTGLDNLWAEIQKPELTPPQLEAEVNVIIGDLADFKFFVNGEDIQSPAPYANSDGVIMAPLRAVSEGLGYEVNWVEDIKGVNVGGKYTLVIGENNYSNLDLHLTLECAPEITDGLTYVPISFFEKVVGLEAEFNGTSVNYVK